MVRMGHMSPAYTAANVPLFYTPVESFINNEILSCCITGRKSYKRNPLSLLKV